MGRKMPLAHGQVLRLEGVEDKINQNRLGAHQLEALIAALEDVLPQAHERVQRICRMVTERSYYQASFITQGGVFYLVKWVVSELMPKQSCLSLIVGLDAISLKRSVVNRRRFVACGGILALCYLVLTNRDSLEFWQTNPGKAIHFLNSATKLASPRELKNCLKLMRRACRHLKAKVSDSTIVRQLELNCASGGVSQPPSLVEKLIVTLGEEWVEVCAKVLERIHSDRSNLITVG